MYFLGGRSAPSVADEVFNEWEFPGYAGSQST